MTLRTNRRDFLKGSAAAGIGFWVAGRMTWAAEVEQAKSPNEKVNCASIGVGGKGDGDSEHVAKYGNLVAICDVDEERLEEKAQKHPKAKKFTDFRKMFDAMGKEIDAVTISTPDHTHAVATMMAIKLGKAVYTQKPLTHDIWESRQLRMAARQHKVASQMGNQGTALGKFREGVEVIRAGALGPVKEVHIWTNRPIWPQAPKVTSRPKEAPVPPNLKWDLWLGTAPERPYAEEPGYKPYHPFNWRGFWDFGTGALGDMGCHTANLPFMALKLEYPTSIHGESEELNKETYPAWARVTYEFPAREGMPPVKVVWYEGRKDGKLVHPPEELVEKVLKESGATQLNSSGSIVVGEKGIMYSPHDYGGAWSLLPKEQYEDYKSPEPTLPRNPVRDNDEAQKVEWLAAVKGGPASLANFDYAGLLAEFILLGNVGIREQGKTLKWDGPNLKFTNDSGANKWLKREYRKPWSLDMA